MFYCAKNVGTLGGVLAKVVDSEHLEPRPRMFQVFRNAGYSFEAAIADLVDNSVDAKARTVLIRFVRTNDKVKQLLVLDDGHGMDEAGLKEAMTFGSTQEYDEDALGLYGVGLKSASLSSADVLTVVSRSKSAPGRTFGRQWTAKGAGEDGWMVNLLDEEGCSLDLDSIETTDLDFSKSGTLVQWDEVMDFGKASSTGVNKYLGRQAKDLSQHLGMHFHRLIENKTVRILVDSFNSETKKAGPSTVIKAIDPFGYPKSGHKEYPKEFFLKGHDLGELRVQAHIWPKLKTRPLEYKFDGVNGRQGLYFYRNDRLLHGGGWANERETEPHSSLARAIIDLPKEWESTIRVIFNKSGVITPVSFSQALTLAEAKTGARWREYLKDAEEVYRKKKPLPPRLYYPVNFGIPHEVVQELKNNVGFLEAKGVAVTWSNFLKDDFFKVEREKKTLMINQKYRAQILGGRLENEFDAPLLKTLLYLLMEPHFRSKPDKNDLEFIEGIQEALKKALL